MCAWRRDDWRQPRRKSLSTLLREFATLTEPSDSIEDRAVRLGVYRDDAAVLIPLADFERALENEELLDNLLLEITVDERLAADPGETFTIEEIARQLGLEAALEPEPE
jgi:hypothetical protein